MAKIHDKYVVELAEVILGYGNDPDINDPFCLSTFYRFYEVPNVCVSAENLKKMRPLSDYTEEIEPESISEWKKEFREYVDSLDITKDDWKGIIEYIDEPPPIQPERKTGRWIPDDSELGIKCNKCGKSFSDYVNAGTGYMFLDEIPNFCPNCGADMRGEQDE